MAVIASLCCLCLFSVKFFCCCDVILIQCLCLQLQRMNPALLLFSLLPFLCFFSFHCFISPFSLSVLCPVFSVSSPSSSLSCRRISAHRTDRLFSNHSPQLYSTGLQLNRTRVARANNVFSLCVLLCNSNNIRRVHQGSWEY